MKLENKTMPAATAERPPDFVVGNYYNKHRSKNPVVRWIMSRYRETLWDLLAASPENSILEVGCGEGEILRWLHGRLPKAALTGVDLEAPIFAEAQREFPTIQFAVANASRLPYEDRRFDAVLCCQVLEHADDPDSIVREVRRVTRRKAVFSVPLEPDWRILNCMSGRYLMRGGNTPGHIQHWSVESFLRLLRPHFRQVRHSLRAYPFTFVEASKG
jgi:2-polyprenyl-3-methyl-5-hydroxy-6-metoxy-1,4-benzoquinol methylase